VCVTILQQPKARILAFALLLVQTNNQSINQSIDQQPLLVLFLQDETTSGLALYPFIQFIRASQARYSTDHSPSRQNEQAKSRNPLQKNYSHSIFPQPTERTSH
jgi:hypothetical protein